MSAKSSHEPLWINHLSSLDAQLRAAGFFVSPDRWLNIGDLLLALRRDNQLPLQPLEVRRILAPLVCSSAREQQDFQTIFSHWWHAQAAGQTVSAPAQVEAATAVASAQATAKGVGDRFSAGRMRMVFAVAIVLLAGVSYVYDNKRSAGAEGEVVSADTLSNTMNGNEAAESTAASKPSSSRRRYNSDYRSELQAGKTDLASDIPVMAVPPRFPLEDAEHIPDLKSLNLVSGLVFNLLWALLIAGLPLFFLLLFFRGALRQTLRKKKGDANSPLSTVHLRLAQDNLFDGPSIRKAIKRLHSPQLYATRRLQTEKTVDASVRHAGLFTPVFAERAEVPEVMLWISNRGRHDPIQALADTFVERLQSSDLRVQSYSYQKSPQRLLHRKTQQWQDQAEVISMHPNARIVIVACAEHLFDVSTHRIAPWLLALSNRHSVVVLETSRFQASLASELKKNGISLAPFSSVGINYLFCELTATPFVAEPQLLPLLPDVLANTVRWRVPVPPSKQEKLALLNTLKAYLGEPGFVLFTAVAAYPEFRWVLVRALDLRMNPDDRPLQRESRLLAIAQLPWSRDGWLPDWLRLALLESTDKQTRKEIRKHYQHLIVGATSSDKPLAVLPVRLAPVSADTRGAIRDLFRWSKKGSSLEDGVFVELMLGGRFRRLDFELPRAIEKVVPLSYAARNFMTAVGVFAFVGLFSFGSYFLFHTSKADSAAETFLLGLEGKSYPIAAKFIGTQRSYALLKQLAEVAAPGIEAQQLSLSEMRLPQNLKRAAYQQDAAIFFQRNYRAEAQWLAQRVRYLAYGLTPVLVELPASEGSQRSTPLYLVLRNNFAPGQVFRDPVVEVELNQLAGDEGQSLLEELAFALANQLSQRLAKGRLTGSLPTQSRADVADNINWQSAQRQAAELAEAFPMLEAYRQLFGEKPMDIDFLAGFATEVLRDRYGGIDALKSQLANQPLLKIEWYNQDLVSGVEEYLSALPVSYLIYAQAKHLFRSQYVDDAATDSKILQKLGESEIVSQFFSASALSSLPSYLTRQYYRSFLETTIPQAIEQAVEELESLGEYIDDDTLQQVFDQTKALYIDDYIGTWQEILDALVVVNLFKNSRQSSASLDLLQSASNNVFRALITGFSQQISDESLFDPEINHAFASYTELLGSDKAETAAKVDQLWAAVEPVFSLAREKLASGEPQAWSHSFASAEFTGSDGVLQTVFQQAQNAPQPLRRWMLSVVEQFWRVQLNDAQAYIEAQWAMVYRQCKNMIEGKFPVQRGASPAISMSEFSEYFADQGIEQTFSQEFIEPYISPQSKASEYGDILFFNVQALEQSARANNIREAYFNLGQYTRHNFRLRFNTLVPAVKQITLWFDDKTRIAYSHGPTVWQSFSWQPRQNSSVRLDLSGAQLANPSELNRSGAWSLLRFLDAGNLEQLNETDYSVYLNSGAERVAVLDINAQANSELLTSFLQPSYQCVEQLFVGDQNGE